MLAVNTQRRHKLLLVLVAAKSNKQDKQLKPTTAKNKKSPPEKPASAKATKSAKSKAKAKAGKK